MTPACGWEGWCAAIDAPGLLRPAPLCDSARRRTPLPRSRPARPRSHLAPFSSHRFQFFGPDVWLLAGTPSPTPNCGTRWWPSLFRPLRTPPLPPTTAVPFHAVRCALCARAPPRPRRRRPRRELLVPAKPPAGHGAYFSPPFPRASPRARPRRPRPVPPALRSSVAAAAAAAEGGVSCGCQVEAPAPASSWRFAAAAAAAPRRAAHARCPRRLRSGSTRGRDARLSPLPAGAALSLPLTPVRVFFPPSHPCSPAPMRPLAAAVVLLLASACAPVRGGRAAPARVGGRRQLAPTPPSLTPAPGALQALAGISGPPNVLLIFTDDLSQKCVDSGRLRRATCRICDAGGTVPTRIHLLPG